MAFAATKTAARAIVISAFFLQGCLRITVTGHASGSDLGPASSTTAAAGASGGTGDLSSGGSTGSISTGGAAGGASTSGSTGTTGGSACHPGPSSNLQNVQGYLPDRDYCIAASSADFNGDGLLDLVVECGTSALDNRLYMLVGLPDGGLGPPISSVGLGGSLTPVVAADLNGDGRPDVLYATGTNQIEVLLNANGSLLAPQPLTQTSADLSIVALAVGDLNQDGIADVVDAESGGVAFPDNGLLVVNIFLGLGDGGFQPADSIASLQGMGGIFFPALFVADLNQDGVPDIVVTADQGAELVVLIHDADAGYSPMFQTVGEVVALQLIPRDGGAPDLVVGYDSSDSSGFIQRLWNDGHGNFSQGPTYAVPNLTDELAVADFNADGIPDVAVGSNGCPQTGEGLAVFFGDSDGGFGDAPELLPMEATGMLTPLGPVSAPRALAGVVTCPQSDYVYVYGDASCH